MAPAQRGRAAALTALGRDEEARAASNIAAKLEAELAEKAKVAENRTEPAKNT
jgi:hypothetical protein